MNNLVKIIKHRTPNTMKAQLKTQITPEDYLEVERLATYKSEYYAGEMFAMAGASKRHNLIVSNLIRILGNQLLEGDCNVYPSDMRIKIAKVKKYTYADVVIACGREEFDDQKEDTLLNPVVIIEVLSDSTEAYDRGQKFVYYQMLPSLQEYLLVSQHHCQIEQFVRNSERFWTYAEYHDAEDIVPIRAINVELRLKDIYARLPPENTQD